MEYLSATDIQINCLKEGNKELWVHLKNNLQYSKILHFTNISFENCDWKNFDFKYVRFEKCNFKNCDFSYSDIRTTVFVYIETIENCNFSNTISGKIPNDQYNSATHFVGIDNTKKLIVSGNSCFENLDDGERHFSYVSFLNTSFKNSIFIDNYFSVVLFYNSNLENTFFRNSQFLKDIYWDKSLINNKTKFINCNFHEDTYPYEHDLSESMVFSKSELPSWKHIQFLSKVPIFQASFIAFIFTLFLANVIVTINEWKYFEAMNYPIQMPRHLYLVLISSFSLFLGALIYRIFCPENIQNFTASEWVIEHKKPRPVYLSLSLESLKARRFCFGFLLVGGSIALWLILCRVLDVIFGIHHNCLFCHSLL